MELLIEGPVTPEIVTAVVSEAAKDKTCGGHDIFLGQVRNDVIDGKEVTAIEYSAYGPMVKKEAELIVTEIREQFGDVRSVVILHSNGIVKAGQVSLLVIVSAGHRKHAIEACREAVEKIKSRFPVWKKELFADDSHRWRENQ